MISVLRPNPQQERRVEGRHEKRFGYLEPITGIAKLKVRGHLRAWGVVALALAAFNLTRHAKLARA